MTPDEIAMRQHALDELYQSELRAKGRLVSRFAGHNLVSVTTYDGSGKPKSSIDQMITAALIEAYRLGFAEAEKEANETAKRRLAMQLESAQRELDNAYAVAKKALRPDR